MVHLPEPSAQYPSVFPTKLVPLIATFTPPLLLPCATFAPTKRHLRAIFTPYLCHFWAAFASSLRHLCATVAFFAVGLVEPGSILSRAKIISHVVSSILQAILFLSTSTSRYNSHDHHSKQLIFSFQALRASVD